MMCLAIPGKIVKIENDVATIEYPSENREAKILDGSYTIGDYVFVTAKIVVQKIPTEEALESLKGWNCEI